MLSALYKILFFVCCLPCFNLAQAQSEARPDINDPDDEAWSRVYRSSDNDPKNATTYQRHKANNHAEKSKNQMDLPRVGCICMDGIAQQKTERGACSGHKGVRFWVYQRTNGDTLLNATERHLLHPEPLAADAPIVFGQGGGGTAATPTTDTHGWELAFYILLSIGAGGTVLTIVIRNYPKK